MEINLTIGRSIARKRLLLMIMKTFIFLFCTTVFSFTTGTTLAQEKITIYSDRKATIDEVFQLIMNQTKYNFLYPEDLFKDMPKVQLKKGTIATDKLINQSLSAGRFDVILTADDTIIIKEAKAGQKVEVSGKVLDEKGIPIPGAMILIKGTLTATTTDFDGFYKLTVPDPANVLIVSSLGFVHQDIVVGNRTKIDIILKLEVSKLNEVVVNAGYYNVSERTSVGSITTVTAKDIKNQPVNNILDALVGRVPGMQVIQSSGIPGSAPSVEIRGRSSITSTFNPLYIINGIPIEAAQNLSYGSQALNGQYNILAGLNPQDVESVTVLKDADATSIYGSRGANGVILITTKQGESGKTTFGVNVSQGVQTVGHFMKMLNADQYDAMRREAFANDGITPTPDNAPDLYFDKSKTHDWQKELIGGTSLTQDVSLSVSGGNKNTRFYGSAAYHSEGTVMPGDSKFERKTAMLTVNHISENKKFSADFQATYALTNLNLLPIDVSSNIGLPPNYPLYKDDGTPNWEAPNGFPLVSLLQKFYAPTRNYGLNVKLRYEILPGLDLKFSGGEIYNNVDQSTESPSTSLDPYNWYPLVPTLKKQIITNTNWILEPQIQYVKNIKKNHFTVLAGTTFQKLVKNTLALEGEGFVDDALIGNIGSANKITYYPSSIIPTTTASIYGRLGYDFNQEYLFNATFRRDGSSRFGPDQRFGNFGSIGVGWNFTDRIHSVLPLISFGKATLTYGTSGNDQVGDYAYLDSYTNGSQSGGYNGLSALNPSRLANPNFQWEVNKKFEAGLNLGFLENKIMFKGSYFKNRSGNQLVYNKISSQAGYSFYLTNIGATIQNEGLEFTLTTTNIDNGSFRWTTNFNISKSKSKLVSFPDWEKSYYTSYEIGQSMRLIKAFPSSGLDNTGAPVYEGTTSQYPDQNLRVSDGNNDPFYGGLGNEFTYKGFNFSFYFTYNRTRESKNYLPSGTPGQAYANFSTYVLDRWQNPGDEANTTIPRFTTGYNVYTPYYYNNATLNIADNNVFRLNNVSISYNLPQTLMRKINMSSLRLFVNGQNLYVFDKYKDYRLDPDAGTSSLPQLRTIAFGLNATF